MVVGEFEQFIGKVRIGNADGMLEITIPAQLVTFMGLETGDTVKIMIRKYLKENNQNQEEE